MDGMWWTTQPTLAWSHGHGGTGTGTGSRTGGPGTGTCTMLKRHIMLASGGTGRNTTVEHEVF